MSENLQHNFSQEEQQSFRDHQMLYLCTDKMIVIFPPLPMIISSVVWRQPAGGWAGGRLQGVPAGRSAVLQEFEHQFRISQPQPF